MCRPGHALLMFTLRPLSKRDSTANLTTRSLWKILCYASWSWALPKLRRHRTLRISSTLWLCSPYEVCVAKDSGETPVSHSHTKSARHCWFWCLLDLCALLWRMDQKIARLSSYVCIWPLFYSDSGKLKLRWTVNCPRSDSILTKYP